ncbi:MAG: hypothetical protein Q9183_004708 [Haloplaca sp. 2 TL-2023]
MDSTSEVPAQRVRLSKDFMEQNHLAGVAECSILANFCAKCTEFIRQVLSLPHREEPSRRWACKSTGLGVLEQSSEYLTGSQCVLCVLAFDPASVNGVLRMERKWLNPLSVELNDDYRRTTYDLTLGRDADECLQKPLKDVPEVQGHYPAEHPQSTGVATQIQEWYQGCKSRHPNCHRGQEILPRRLLHLAEDATSGKVSLVNVHRLNVPTGSIEYLALSYCWGKSTNSRSLRANIDDRERYGLDVIDLPLAIQDALAVTRQLGFGYLWVDAICICQDDEAEWDAEAAKMADIYGGSQFAISALASPDADEPFLLPRYFEAAEIGSIKRIDVEQGAAEEYALQLFLRERPWNIKTELKTARLNSRAWSFQERILAPGVLHYGCDQAFWECNEYRGGGISETGLGPETEPERLYERLSLRLSDEDPGSLWHNLVKDLTRRDLTVFSDRLYAISGLAARLRKMNIFGGRYVAGLWETRLVFDLMWSTEDDIRSLGSVDDVGHLRQNSRVATWSWAHIDKPVWYNGGLTSPYGDFRSDLLAPPRFVFDHAGQDLQSIHPGAVVPSCQILLRGFVQEMARGAAECAGADWFLNEATPVSFDILDPQTANSVSCYSIRMVSNSHAENIHRSRPGPDAEFAFPYEIEYLLLEKVDVEIGKDTEARSIYRRIGHMRLELEYLDEPLLPYRDLLSDYGEPILVNGRWEDILLI